MACDDDASSDAQSNDAGDVGGPPLSDVALSLSCAAPVVSESSCGRDADCAEGERCIADPGATHADRTGMELTCGQPREGRAARERCARATDCASGLCALADVCLTPCQRDDDCLAGQTCTRVEARWGEGLQPVQACARSFAFTADVSLTRANRVEDLDVASPRQVETPGVEGAAIAFLKPDCGAQLRVQTLRALDDEETLLFDLGQALAGNPAPNPVVNEGTLVPVLVPNNPDVPVSRGGYALDVAVDGDTGLELVVASRARRGKLLDLNLFYVGGGEDVVEGGMRPGSTDMGRVLAELSRSLQGFGLTLGHVREHDVVGALRDELAILETTPVLDEEGALIDLEIENIDRLFELSAGVDDGGVNLFLVRDMGDVLGISGGIPGAVGAHGTAASGVAVAVDVVGIDALLSVILHEMSHQLGLFHTSELNGFVLEPLADTPECRQERDQDGDGLLMPDECRGAGADNLMFWAGTGSALSPQQIAVIEMNPALR